MLNMRNIKRDLSIFNQQGYLLNQIIVALF